MTIVSKRTVYLLLVALILLSIAVRYPLVEHERNQTDSYFIHNLSQSVVDNGRAKWIFNPLSYVGYYQLSYPSGVPFLLAEVSSMTGLSIETSILLVDLVIAALFTLAVFVLAKHFLRRPELILLATFFALLCSRFVDTSYWSGSARAMAVVLTTLVVFTLFRASLMGQNRLLLVAVLLGIGCFATHHLAILLALFGIGYVLAAFQTQFLIPRVRLHKRTAALAWNVLVVATIVIVVFVYFDFFESLGFEAFQKTPLFELNPPLLSVIANLAVSYINQIGFVLVVAIIGIPGLFGRSYLGMEAWFPLTLLLAFIPLLGNTLYVSMLLAPFVAVLGVVMISRLFRSLTRKGFAVFAVVILMASSIILPIWSTQRWNEREYLSGETVVVGDQFFNDASYMRENTQGASAISNVNVMKVQLSATSHVIFLGSGIYLTLSGDIRAEDIQPDIPWSVNFPRNLYKWFEDPTDPNVDFFVQALMMQGISFIEGPSNYTLAVEYFSNHTKLLVAVDNFCPSRYVDSYINRPAKFLTEIQRPVSSLGGPEFLSYKTYQTEGLTLYLVQLPIRPS